MRADEKAVHLSGGLKHTATWVKISNTGDLVVDYYDYSEDAHNHLGNDVAYLLTVEASEKLRMMHLLTDEIESVKSDLDDAILKLMQTKFDSYFQIEQWLKDNNITFQKSFDPWA